MVEAPRGTVTFLFSDVEGSTKLLRSIGQEAYGRALDEYQLLVRDACRGQDGYEIDTQGDAFFFSFVRAKDAALAAVECQRAISAHAWPEETKLRARVGLHTGEARVVESRYVGLSVHRAARICAAAHGGQIVCSSATASVLEDEELGALTLRPLGLHSLKDFEHPVALHQLEGPGLERDFAALAAVSSEAGTEPSRGVLVGRETEVAELFAGLDAAFAGQGRLFLLVGEPGIGKSRLAEELTARARARGATVLMGRCWEAGGAPAYWPWVQSLRAYVRDAEAEVLRAELGSGAPDLAQLLPELRELFPDLPEPPALEPESARFRMFEAASSFLRSAAGTRPLVLVLDDLHAADEPSLLLLQFLARELGGSRLLVVGACRDVDPTPGRALWTALAELGREPVTTSLALKGLGESDVAQFIELTSGEAPAEALVAGIFEETEGNPLFVGEIVRLLAAEGSLAAESPSLSIPPSVRDVIARRLHHLSEECNRLLVLASVLGREFSVDALAQLGDISEDAVLDALDEAMAARVVSDVPGAPGQMRFAHLVIRDTLYEGLTSVRRVRLHRGAIAALEALYDEPGSHLTELTYHAMAGSDFGKALLYARSAGDRALDLLAYEEAARLYTTALEALDHTVSPDEQARCELLLLLGEAETRAGSSSAAKAAFLDAAEIARRLDLSRELARAAVGYGGRIVWERAGEDHRLVPLLEEGLAVLAEEDVELRARLMARLAGALREERSRDRRDALSREAVELARHTEDPAALAYALDGRAAAIIAPDTIAECLALGGELCQVAERSRDPERIVAGYMWRIMAQLTLGDVGAAEVDLAAAAGIAGELGQPDRIWEVAGTRAMLALAAGRLDEAEELVPQTFAIGELAQPEGAIPIYRVQRYTLCDFRGSLDDVESEIRDLVGEYPGRPVFRCVLVHLLARLGRTAEAKRALDSLAEDDFSVLPFEQEWLFGMSLLAETSVLLGDAGAVATLYGLLAPWAALNIVDQAEGIRGSVSRYLGLLAAMLEHWDDAAQHFEQALEMNERMGARPWLAYTQEDYARTLLAHDEKGDRDRAGELFEAALATYEELGMAEPERPYFELA